MDRFDVLDGDEHRLEVFGGRLLEPEPDEDLQRIVSTAAQVAAAPIALISLLLRRIQFFRAHVGLPPGLTAMPATDRCASFCQLVVRDGQPLEINDAAQDARVPQQLVEQLGIRAYLGVPLALEGTVVGTLCVLDVTPRRFDPAVRAQLERMAGEASERLAQLLDDPLLPRRASNVHQGLSGLADAMSKIRGDIAVARCASIELGLRVRALESQQARPLAHLITDTAISLDDLRGALARIDEHTRRGFGLVAALSTATAAEPVRLRDAIASAAALSGLRIRWRGEVPAVTLMPIHAALVARLLHGLRGQDHRAGPISVTAADVQGTLHLRLDAGGQPLLGISEDVLGDAGTLPGVSARVVGGVLEVSVPTSRAAGPPASH